MVKTHKSSYKVNNIVDSNKSRLQPSTYRPTKPNQDDGYTYTNWSINGNSKSTVENTTFVPKLYARRWLYLAVAFILNVSDGAIWICYASVTNVAASYYNVSIASINWFSMIFFIVYLPVIFVAMWIFDKWGFNVGVYWGCGTNLVGCLIRLFGTFDFVPASYRFPITFAGQVIASLTQPFCMCMPTKLSQDWFPEHQRTISTTIISLSNLAGSMIASLISPVLASKPEDIPLLNIVMSGFGIFAGAIGILVREAKPPSPPSISAAKANEDRSHSSIKTYMVDLKKLLFNKQFMLLMFTAAATGVGLVYTWLTVLQQMLCSFNYTNSFSGLCTALMIAGGLFGSLFFTMLAQKTKRLEEIITITFSLSVLIDIGLVLMSNMRGLQIPLTVVCVLVGILNLGVYPVTLEVAVEVTYPIEQYLSAGIIACWQQIQGASFVPLITSMGIHLNNYQLRYQTCTIGTSTEAYDMTNGALCLMGLVTFFNIILLIFFRPTFKRSELEKLKMLQNLQLANSKPMQSEALTSSEEVPSNGSIARRPNDEQVVETL